MTAKDHPCPRCGAEGTADIEIKLVAEPIGSFSLAGAQMKVSARTRPVLICTACGLSHPGEFDGDRHAFFAPILSETS